MNIDYKSNEDAEYKQKTICIIRLHKKYVNLWTVLIISGILRILIRNLNVVSNDHICNLLTDFFSLSTKSIQTTKYKNNNIMELSSCFLVCVMSSLRMLWKMWRARVFSEPGIIPTFHCTVLFVEVHFHGTKLSKRFHNLFDSSPASTTHMFLAWRPSYQLRLSAKHFIKFITRYST